MRRMLLAFLLLLFCWPVWAQPIPLGAFGCTNAQVSTCQLKTAGGQLFDFQLSNVAGTATWSFVMDTATVPVNGTIAGCTTAQPPCLLKAYQLSTTGGTIGVSWIPGSILFFGGLVIACSTTAPPTLTLSATCFMSGETQ